MDEGWKVVRDSMMMKALVVVASQWAIVARNVCDGNELSICEAL